MPARNNKRETTCQRKARLQRSRAIRVRMKELIIFGLIALCVFAAVFYQSYRDKQRWKRIASGMSLFGEREDIPPLELEGDTFDAHERRVLVIWGNRQQSSFETVSDAKRRIEEESGSGKSRAEAARIFAWDGGSWKQRR